MNPVARVTINIYRNLRTQQMPVLVFIVHFLHYMFRPQLVAIFRWFVIQKIRRQLPYMSTDPLRQYVKCRSQVSLNNLRAIKYKCNKMATNRGRNM
jgi:hypothetical protein